ncbi:MAG: CPBP family intramembrane metalloprotease [Gemmatimonadetes bacterium]|nr:CPBP family intramembrane metalloprotease [Gemmatimonadota bacterium]
MERSWLRVDGRARAGWRVLLYVALLLLLAIAAQFAAALLPRTRLDWLDIALLTAAGLIAGWVMLARFDERPPGALGFAITRATPGEILFGFVLGSALIAAATILLLLSGTATFVPDTGTAGEYVRTLAWTFAFFSIAAAAEEVLFRGYAFQALVEAIGVWPTVLVTSALFAAVHLGNPEVDSIAVVNIFLAGVLLGFAYLRTRSLWFATALHSGWNWTMAAALGFPVSGLVLLDTPLYDAVETGADWWTGGGFGPEAGLAGTLVIVAGTAWTVRTKRLHEPPEMRALRPLVDSRLPEGGP